MMNEKLSIFGTSFQIKVITLLLIDGKFLQTVYDLISPDIFDSDGNRWIVNYIISYYEKYMTIPTLDVLKIEINQIEDEILQVSVIENLKAAWKYRLSQDLDYIKEKLIEFCKNQALKNAIIESVDKLERQEYDEIKRIIDNAMKIGEQRDIGHNYIEGLEERLSRSARDILPTPWIAINNLMDGGLGKGELGVVVAPAGIGKSWALQSIGADSLKHSKSVLHYTLELNQNYVGLRYDTVITGIPTGDIKYNVEEIKEKIKSLPGKLLIKHYPTRSASVKTLFAHVKQMEIYGIKPNLIVVDYADLLMDTSNHKEIRHQLNAIYEDLRGLAGEIDVPIWTASQANRSSLEEDIIEAGKVAESYGKIMAADFVMSISRKVEDKLANTGRCHVMKNRFGPDGITLPMNMNTSIGKVDIYEDISVLGQQQQNKMDHSEETLKKHLKNRYNDLMEDDTIKKEGFE